MNGLEVKKKLKENGFILARVAETMGMLPQSLNTLLKAKEVKLSTLERIAEAINKPLEFFLGEDTPDIPKKIKVYPDSNLDRVILSVNEQAEKPIFKHEVLNTEDAVRQLLAMVAEKDMELKKVIRERDDYKDRYLKLLEELSGKKDQGKCG